MQLLSPPSDESGCDSHEGDEITEKENTNYNAYKSYYKIYQQVNNEYKDGKQNETINETINEVCGICGDQMIFNDGLMDWMKYKYHHQIIITIIEHDKDKHEVICI